MLLMVPRRQQSCLRQTKAQVSFSSPLTVQELPTPSRITESAISGCRLLMAQTDGKSRTSLPVLSQPFDGLRTVNLSSYTGSNITPTSSSCVILNCDCEQSTRISNAKDNTAP